MDAGPDGQKGKKRGQQSGRGRRKKSQAEKEEPAQPGQRGWSPAPQSPAQRSPSVASSGSNASHSQRRVQWAKPLSAVEAPPAEQPTAQLTVRSDPAAGDKKSGQQDQSGGKGRSNSPPKEPNRKSKKRKKGSGKKGSGQKGKQGKSYAKGQAKGKSY